VPRWYTFSSGIWQTVWLEGCAPSYVASLRVVPDVVGKQAMLYACLSLDHGGDYDLTVHALDGAFDPVEMSMTLDAGRQDVVVTIPIAEPRLWSPESPFLYNFAIDLTSS